MIKIVSLFLSLSLTIPTWASCPNPVIKLEKGQEAPCLGYLFSPEKERELYKKNEERKITLKQLRVQDDLIKVYKKDIKSLEKINDKQKEKITLWKKTAEKTTKELVESEEGRGTRDWIFFALGVVATGFSAYVLDKVR